MCFSPVSKLGPAVSFEKFEEVKPGVPTAIWQKIFAQVPFSTQVALLFTAKQFYVIAKPFVEETPLLQTASGQGSWCSSGCSMRSVEIDGKRVLELHFSENRIEEEDSDPEMDGVDWVAARAASASDRGKYKNAFGHCVDDLDEDVDVLDEDLNDVMEVDSNKEDEDASEQIGGWGVINEDEDSSKQTGSWLGDADEEGYSFKSL